MSFQTINDVIYLDSQPYTTTSGDNHDVSLASSNFQVTCTADGDGLTGLIPPLNSDGAQVWVQNASSTNTLVIKSNNSGSTSGYRFILTPFTTLSLEPGEAQQFGFLPSVGWLPIRTGTYS